MTETILRPWQPQALPTGTRLLKLVEDRRLEDNVVWRLHRLEVWEGQFRIAHLDWKMDGEMTQIYVTPNRRRQGIATALWLYAHATYGTRHSRERTRDGEAWARSLGQQLPPLIPM